MQGDRGALDGLATEGDRASMRVPAAGFGWRPGIGTAAVLLVAVLVACWLFTPTWSAERGIDAKDWYAAASLQSRGGNPYDPNQQGAEQDRLFNNPAHLHAGQPGYARAPYAYPPLFTLAVRSALPLGFDGFYFAFTALLIAAGMVGFEALLRVVGWRQRWLARAFFLTSVPMALSLFVGNPSPILLLGWASALFLTRGGRPFAGGLLLTLCLLKLPVGLPAAAALLLAPGSGRRALAAGFAAGSVGLAAIQLSVMGPEATADWIRGLGVFTGALGGHAGSAVSFSELAGAPAIFLDFMPTAMAVLLGLILIGAVLLLAARHLVESDEPVPEDLLLAVVLVAAVAATPYAHLNDLVILALPLLLLVNSRPRVLTRTTELTWFIGIHSRLFLVVLASVALNYHPISGSAGIGVVLVLMLLLALPIASRPGRRVDTGS